MNFRTCISISKKLIAGVLSVATWSFVVMAEETPPVSAEPSSTDVSTTAEESSPAPSAEQIGAWIVELDDDQYVVREQATAQLIAAGAAALDSLLATANGDRPEPADRAVWVLRKLSVGTDLSVRRRALERLVQLERRSQVVASAQKALAAIRHQEAAQAITALGGQFLIPNYPGAESQSIVPQVVLDQRWRGGDDEMKLFGDLQGLRQVIIIAADVTPEGLAELRHVEMLERLWIYRTKLESDEIPALSKLLPRVEIDFRRGALLGVAGDPREGTPGPATVSEVRAGSVAAKADMHVGDIVKTFHGKPVRDFKDLTTKIAEHYPGDEVKLEILRDGEQIDLTVQLGEWSSDQILSQVPR